VGQTTPTGGERNLNFFELPKRKHLKGGGEPFEKIKEKEERKQKKKKKGGGSWQPWMLPHPRWQAFLFFPSWKG
jgi:hypothetical protein